MNTNETDPQLRHLFLELKREDARRTPAFSIAAKTQASRQVVVWPWFVTSALAILVLGVLSDRNEDRTPNFEDDSSSWASFSTWTAPSDALLSPANSSPAAEADEHTHSK